MMTHFTQWTAAAPSWVSHIHNTASHDKESGDIGILETSRNFICKAPKPSS